MRRLIGWVAYQWYWWTQCRPALRAMDRSVAREMKSGKKT